MMYIEEKEDKRPVVMRERFSFTNTCNICYSTPIF